MSDSSKLSEIEELRQNMSWAMEALQYIYNNCDENSEFFEMVCDARLFFMQANMGLENLLRQLPVELLVDPNKPTPHIE